MKNGNKMKNGKFNSSVFSHFHKYHSLSTQNEAHKPTTDLASLPSTLQYYINSNNPSYGQTLHTHILKAGLRPNTNISIKLLVLHLKSRCLNYARQVFDELPKATLSAYNYMIGGYLKEGRVVESIALVRRLVCSGEKPDGFTLSMILKAGSDGFTLHDVGRQVHAKILRLDVEPDDVLYTALVDSYVKSGRVCSARMVFDMMLEKNVVCATSMISGYMNEGCVEEAEEVFDKTVEKDIVVFNAMIEGYSKMVETAKKSVEVYIAMQRLGFRPNISTFSSLIGACSVLAAVDVGYQIQGQVMKTELFMDVKLGSALIDMYSKCGEVEDARKVFDQMIVKNVFSWTSMIDGYGKNGYPELAIELFNMMQEYGVKPNLVTFLGALSACGHAGLVAKGHEIFETMEINHSTKPRMEHYACMVDLFGRAGRLQEAWDFVMKMPMKPNSDVWAALLSACQVHGDVEMAKVAADELFNLNADNRPGAYVALSNTLAAAGKWSSVSELRESMKFRGVSKDTGWSWVGTDSGLQGFHVGQIT